MNETKTMFSNIFVQIFILKRLCLTVFPNICDTNVNDVSYIFNNQQQMSIVQRLSKLTFNQCVKLCIEKNCAKFQHDISNILSIFMKKCTSNYNQIITYSGKRQHNESRHTSFNNVFACVDLIYYIFQFAASDVNCLKTLSLVDSIWFIHSFDPVAAKFIKLNISLLFTHKNQWTFHRFSSGVKELIFDATDLHNFENELSCNKNILFKKSFKKISGLSEQICIKLNHINIAINQQLCKVLFSQTRNYFNRAKSFNMELVANGYPSGEEQSFNIILPEASFVHTNLLCSDFYFVPLSLSSCNVLRARHRLILEAKNCKEAVQNIRTLLLENTHIQFVDDNNEIIHDINEQNRLLFYIGAWLYSVIMMKINGPTYSAMMLLTSMITSRSRIWRDMNAKYTTFKPQQPPIMTLHISLSNDYYLQQNSQAAPMDSTFATGEKLFDTFHFTASKFVSIEKLHGTAKCYDDIIALERYPKKYSFMQNVQFLSVELTLTHVSFRFYNNQRLHGFFEFNDDAANNAKKLDDRDESTKLDSIFGFKHLKIFQATILSYAHSFYVPAFLQKMCDITRSRRNIKSKCKCSFQFHLNFHLYLTTHYVLMALHTPNFVKNILENILENIHVAIKIQCSCKIDVSFLLPYTLSPDGKDSVDKLCLIAIKEMKTKFAHSKIEFDYKIHEFYEKCEISIRCDMISSQKK